MLLREKKTAQRECVRLAARKAYRRRAERIVHYAVQLAAQKISSSATIRAFIGGVFPHFAEHHGVFILRFRGAVQAVNKAVRQLIGNIQAPAGSTGLKPMPDDAAFAVNIVVIRGIFLAHIRQRDEIPPTFVVVRPAPEAVPRVIRGRLRAVRAAVAVAALAVKINAVAARVAENAVEHNVNVTLFRRRAQRAEIFLIAEQRVNFLIVRRVVTVVALRFKYRIEINAGNPE